MTLAAFVRDNAAVLLLAGAAAGWYAASHAAAEALSGGRLALRRRALGQWLPIATMALVATLAQQTDIAVALLFASSVAALSLVLGIVTIAHEFAARPADPGGFPVIESSVVKSVTVERATGRANAPAGSLAVEGSSEVRILPEPSAGTTDTTTPGIGSPRSSTTSPSTVAPGTAAITRFSAAATVSSGTVTGPVANAQA